MSAHCPFQKQAGQLKGACEALSAKRTSRCASRGSSRIQDAMSRNGELWYGGILGGSPCRLLCGLPTCTGREQTDQDQSASRSGEDIPCYMHFVWPYHRAPPRFVPSNKVPSAMVMTTKSAIIRLPNNSGDMAIFLPLSLSVRLCE